ncbi:acyl-CoA dehydrogenase family protein [Pseudonocardia kujensis]|uniref:acyl-CoA dehydrogenase family protein n=1 Tax=Pseudonocardia kujensis TaxID=1128675 RepID=UPI001E3B50F6|nr:acyl-CoA dehydrogenase family protein [Pseudonocardia kujensis]MCE0762402.1 acyl-CoA dehydrogenase family protein [Pseudonocardia kujensis]
MPTRDPLTRRACHGEAPGRPHATSDRHELLTRVLPTLADSVRAGSRGREEQRTLPYREMHAFRDSGLGSLRVPVALGGAGGSIADVVRTVVRLAAADSNVAQATRAHFVHVERLLEPDVPDAARRLRAVRGMLIGEATSERTGSRPFDLGTRLRHTEGRLLLTGEKQYATGGLFATHLTVLALDDDDRPVWALVPADAPGIELWDDWEGMGQRLTATGSAVFTDVEVDPADVLHAVPGRSGPTVTSSFRALHLAAVAAGIATGAVSDIIAFTRANPRTAQTAEAERAAEDPFVQAAVGEAGILAYTARSVVLSAARALDAAAGHRTPEELAAAAIEVTQAKVAADRAAQRAATIVFDAAGASATLTSAGLDRHWRNARTVASHDPAAHAARTIGDHLLHRTPPPGDGLP